MRRQLTALIAIGLTTAACSTFSRDEPEKADLSAPPLANGYYVEPGDRCAESCPTFGKWRATADVDLYADALDNAQVIARIAAGEEVQTSPGQTLVRPVRGTVTRAGGGLNIGDTVYQLLGDGEGFTYDVWHDGKVLNVEADGDNAPVVLWEERIEGAPASAWWVRVERKDGTKGWVRNPVNFDGMGPLS